MKTLHIAPKLALPLDAVTQTFAILGIRGSGKTNTGVVLAEELLAKNQQVVIIDPVDVWWGLKSAKGGKTAGFEIPVIGGDHADVPLDAAAGAVIADFVADNRASVILALRHLGMNDQRRFATDFAKRLYDRKGHAESRSPLMLIVDEADEFVPQRIAKGHEAMFGAFDRIVRRGRSSGLGVTLISQRPQVINKDVLSQMETLVAMRVLHRLDRAALEAWIEAHDTEGRGEEFLESLASLERGDAWVWSPSWLQIFERVHIRERTTFDSSATPKAGEQLAPPKKIADVDLAKLRESMAATIERAKADDPRELRRQIAELQKELRTKASAAVSGKTSIDPSRLQAEFERGAATEWKKITARFENTLGRAQAKWNRFIQHMEDPLTELQGLKRELLESGAFVTPRPAPLTMPSSRRDTIAAPAPRVARTTAVSGDGNVSKAGRKLLTALAQFGQCPDTKLGALTGYTAGAGHFGNVLSELRSKGLIDGERSGFRINDAGLAALGPYDLLPTGTELLDYWKNKLSKGAATLLSTLAEVYPESLTDAELGERVGYTAKAGHFGNCLSELRTRDLITGSRNDLRASENLF